MYDSKPIHELAPMTERSARLLAKHYGFSSVEAMAGSFSKNAKVIDFGTGGSDLGEEIAKLRPDINWVNFDLGYDAKTLSELAPDTPPNLIYMKGDVLKAGSVIKLGSIDYALSYALLPHIELTDPKVVLDVLKEISRLLKPDGQMFVGRRFGRHWIGSSSRRSGSVKLSKKEIENDPVIIEKTIKLIRVNGFGRWTTRWLNQFGTGFFGRGHWATYPQHKTLKWQVWDPRLQKFVPAASQDGFKILSRFAVYSSKGVAREARQKVSQRPRR